MKAKTNVRAGAFSLVTTDIVIARPDVFCRIMF